jgi:hypothetical protein
MNLFEFVNTIEQEEDYLSKKSNSSKYTEEDLDKINNLLRVGKKIKDKRLLELYLKLKEAGVLE